MTDIRATVTFIDQTLCEVIVPQLRAAVRQLHEFVGQFPASTSGAAASTTRSEQPPELDADGTLLQAVRLTQVEARAQRPDQAQRKLQRIHELVPTLVLDVSLLSHPSQWIPSPTHRLEAELAYIQWHINQCVRVTPPKAQAGRLIRVLKAVDELAGICTTYQPATARTKFVDVCRAHEAAGLHAEVDDHNYRRQMLCRWCGDFHQMHTRTPPAKLIKLHDRGIKITTTHLRNNGIRAGA